MPGLALDDAAWTNAWRRRSTAEKAFLALGLLAVAVTGRRPVVAAAVVAVCAAAAVLGARVPPRTYLRALAAPLFFVVLSALSIALTVGSAGPDALWSWGPVAVTEGTLARAVEVSWRSCAAMAALMLLAVTTPVTDLLDGLRRLRVPEVVIDVAGLVYRLLFTVLDTARAVHEAQSARLGYCSGRAARQSFGMLAAAALRQSWVRAHRLESGLAGRGAAASSTVIGAARHGRQVSWPFVTASAAVLVALGSLSAGVIG